MLGFPLLTATATHAAETQGLWLLGAVVLGLSVATLLAGLLYRLKLPPVLGYILTGVFINPAMLGPGGQASVNNIAHIGVVMLLFMVGLELSPGKLRQMRDSALRVGLLQLGFSTAFMASALMILWRTPPVLALLLGATLSLSSTAIVLKSLEDQQELDTVHGRLSLGTLIVQDMMVVPLLLIWPMLGAQAGAGGDWMAGAVVIGQGLFKALLVLAAAVGLSFKLVPLILDQLARTRSRELFTLSVVCLGLGVALLAQWAGLSMEAGAFIAGLALSGSIYSRQVVADSRPFRDVFATLFFVSVGLVLDPVWLVHHLPSVFSFLIIIALLKIVGAGLAARMCGFSWRTAGWTAFTLFQVGEFAFLLLRGIHPNTLPPAMGQWISQYGNALVHATVLSMFLTPLVLKSLPHWLFELTRTRRPQAEPASHKVSTAEPSPPFDQQDEPMPEIEDSHVRPMCGHTVVVGYGPMGQQVAQALAARYQDYIVVDTNPSTVKRLTQQGVAAVFGDMTQVEVQEAAQISDARVLVLTLPDAKTAAEATRLAHRLNPELNIISRVRFGPDIQRLLNAGACHAVHEELEAGLRLALLTLLSMGFNEQEAYATRLMLRERQNHDTEDSDGRRGWVVPTAGEPETILGRLTLLAGTQVEWFEVCPQTPLDNERLDLAAAREQTGANLIGVISARTGDRHDLTAETELSLGDVLIAVGTPDQLDGLEDWLQTCDRTTRYEPPVPLEMPPTVEQMAASLD